MRATSADVDRSCESLTPTPMVSTPPFSGTTATTPLLATPSSGFEPFGRYVLYPPIARGGMATVHPARLVGDNGFSRLVAVKRLHPQFADDPDFVAMFHDEAHIASMIHHPNVVPVLDVVVTAGEVVLVQEYVHGVPLNQLMKAAQLSNPIPLDVAVAILAGILSGLHAAHELRDEHGELLDVVHRDVSPQNVIVSVDGIARLLDFGIAKARTCAHHTREGVFKGKLAYMAPEQIRMEALTRRADVYAAGVVGWELFANRRFHQGESDVDFVASILEGTMPSVSEALATDGPARDADARAIAAVDAIVARALRPRPDERFASALEMRDALLAACPPARTSEVAEWVQIAGAELLEKRKRALAAGPGDEGSRSHSRIAAISRMSSVPMPPTPPAPPAAASIPPPRPSLAPPRVRMPSLAAITPHLALRAMLAACGALLLLVGVLAGVLVASSHDDDPRPSAPRIDLDRDRVASPVTESPPIPRASPADAVVAPREAPAAPPEPRVEGVVVAATTTLRTKTADPPPPAPVRWSPPPRAPSPPPIHASPAAQPMAAPASAPPPATKADCSPPFYFEGTKKVFKPSCL